MQDNLLTKILTFQSIFTSGEITTAEFFISMTFALISGIIFASLCFIKTRSSKSFLLATALLPVTVALVISLVNGNIGMGVAIAGAFSLVRFRSAPGSAKEICIIFIAMASGLAFGIGYVAYGVIFLLFSGVLITLLSVFNFWGKKPNLKERLLRITIPEELDYTNAFEDLFKKYTKNYSLVEVKTVNMGSMFKITYSVTLLNPQDEKKFFDEIRIINGNLEVSSKRIDLVQNEL